ncbi:TM2 domain protein [Salinispira pacifica]|uniref:TM2 domain protein n=2 Tax=Salinispira pacifica TaxID=1307761 RepID=V5WF79_9SPIO|nr:TM2 domain protein [Salinispira pacifica]
MLGFLGPAGIHRFYLGKPVSGLFYLFTYGFFGLGTIIDLFKMPRMVEEANRRLYIERALDDDEYDRYRNYPPRRLGEYDSSPRSSVSSDAPKRPEAKSLEHLIFILAQENKGVLTAAQLALESGIPADQAQHNLELMVAKQYAREGMRHNGLKVFVFEEFLSDSVRAQLKF